MKKLIAMLSLLAVSANANILLNWDFSDGLTHWEGYDVPSSSVLDPSVFVTAGSGSANIAGYSAGETAFYQTFGVGALASGTYTWSADLSNITDPGAFMFIKVFIGGDFGNFDGAKFQYPTLTDGTMSLTYEHNSGDLVQFGFSGFSSSQGFTVSNLSLEVVPEPSSLALLASSLAIGALLRRRKS